MGAKGAYDGADTVGLRSLLELQEPGVAYVTGEPPNQRCRILDILQHTHPAVIIASAGIKFDKILPIKVYIEHGLV